MRKSPFNSWLVLAAEEESQEEGWCGLTTCDCSACVTAHPKPLHFQYGLLLERLAVPELVARLH
jgi:hypothetical protein